MTTVSAASSDHRREIAIENAVAGGKKRGDEIGFQARQQHLRFRIAEAGIVLDELRALRREHQARIENAGIGRAARPHAGERRLDDLAHDAGLQFGRQHGGRRIGAHAAGIRALVAIDRRACGPAPCRRGAAVLPSHRAKKLASSPSRKASITTSAPAAPEAAAEHHVDGVLRLLEGCGDHDALAGRKAVGLHDDGHAVAADIGSWQLPHR